MLNDMTSIDNRWDSLQQPAHPGKGIHAAYRALLAIIDQGWQVVSVTRVISPLRTDMGYYLFALRGADLALTRNFMVSAVPDIEAFVQENHYPVK
jgi:hypothetical protein